MEIVNFSIENDYGLNYGQELLDLHNCYDFSGLRYEVENRRLDLEWKANGEWVKKASIKQFKLSFVDVSYFKINARDSEIPYSEDTCLSFLGFVSSDEENADSYSLFEHRKEDDHLVFFFESDFAIRVYSQKVEFVSQMQVIEAGS